MASAKCPKCESSRIASHSVKYGCESIEDEEGNYFQSRYCRLLVLYNEAHARANKYQSLANDQAVELETVRPRDKHVPPFPPKAINGQLFTAKDTQHKPPVPFCHLRTADAILAILKEAPNAWFTCGQIAEVAVRRGFSCPPPDVLARIQGSLSLLKKKQLVVHSRPKWKIAPDQA